MQNGVAASALRRCLRRNANDNQGPRYLLLPLLAELGRDAEAIKLFEEYRKDPAPIFYYMRALLAFRAEGDSQESGRLLKKARKANRHVIKHLLEQEETGPLPDTYGFGTEEEGVISASECSRAWKSTPGALDWLAEQAGQRP